jgi:molybdopterin-guanine dinucleotide biosynthesis protein A
VAAALPAAQRLLAAGELRAQALLAALPVRWLDPDELLADPALRAADPALDSLVNVNTPEEYAAALRRAEAE